jgi:hypothetical protein
MDGRDNGPAMTVVGGLAVKRHHTSYILTFLALDFQILRTRKSQLDIKSRHGRACPGHP